MAEMSRPPGVPPEASWDSGWWCWVLGQQDPEGKRIGEWQSWSTTGFLLRFDTFDADGKRTGPYRTYHADGTVAQEGSMDREAFGEGLHISHAPAGNTPWRPFVVSVNGLGSVGGLVRRVEATFGGSAPGWHDVRFFDAAGNACGPRGKILDPAVAKKAKKAKLSPQEKLAALAKKETNDG